MQKNTIHFSLPKTGTEGSAQYAATDRNKKSAEPSPQAVKNILNYSKALHIEPCQSNNSFVEYLTN